MVRISKYHSSKDSVYPSLSLCIRPPFLEKEFERGKDEVINISSYTQFLKGNYWDERMLDIYYDNVTVSLENNLLYSFYVTQSGEKVLWRPIFYASFRSSDMKCFAQL